jgi:hypothetical protein
VSAGRPMSKPPIVVDGMLLCRDCDVFVGFGGVGVAKRPQGQEFHWLATHCWVCERDYSEEIGGSSDQPVLDEGDLWDESICLLSELPEDDGARRTSPLMCGREAAWHILYSGDLAATLTCEGHLGQGMNWREVKDFHRFMSACNLRGSEWDYEGSRCRLPPEETAQ